MIQIAAQFTVDGINICHRHNLIVGRAILGRSLLTEFISASCNDRAEYNIKWRRWMQVQPTWRENAPAARRATVFHALILVSTVICGTLAPTVIGPVLPAIQEHFQTIPGIATLVPVIVTLPMLVLALLAMGIGAISDRIGRKRVLIGALVLYALAGTAPMMLDSIYTILASRAVVGLAEAAVMTVSTSMIGDYFNGRDRDRYASLQTTFASGSAFVFNLLGGMLGTHGWRSPFIAYALPLLLAPLVAIFIWDPSRNADAAQASAAAAKAHGGVEPAFDAWLLARICLVAFGVGMVFMVVPVHLSFMVVALGVVSPAQIGVAYACNSAGVIVGTVLFGWLLSTRLSVPRQFGLGALIGGVGFLLMGNAHMFAPLVAGGVLNGLGCGILLPALVSWGLRSMPFEKRGMGTGAFTAAQFIGYFCSPLVVMPLVGMVGSRAIVVGWAGIALALVGVLALLGSTGARRQLRTS
jgi:MFS family permease